jgi:hypothetical protein
MPVFNPSKPGAVSNPTVPLPTEKTYDTSTVSSRRVPLSSLLTNIEGYPWSTEYYHQYLGPDDAPQPLGLSVDPTLQQYHLIRDFEIRVTDPLTFDFIKERRSERLEGTGMVYPGLITPIRGDMFIADVGDGTVALFALTDVTPMSYFNDTCYQVNYRMTGTLSELHKQNLESKVVKTSFYSKDFLLNGRDPILSTDTVERKGRLESHGHQLLEMFLNEFIDPHTRHLCVPSQEVATFDAYVSGFVQRFFNITQHPLMRKANWPEVYQLQDLRSATLWDLLLEQQPIDTRSLASRITNKVSVVDTWVLKQSPFFGGLYYSSIRRVVWPTDRLDDRLSYPMNESSPRNESLSETLSDTTTITVDVSNSPGGDQPLAFPVLVDDYYVFSEAFYLNDAVNQSWLEHMVTQMLNREAVAAEVLLAVCDSAYGWGTLERYYYTPVLLILINYTIRGL